MSRVCTNKMVELSFWNFYYLKHVNQFKTDVNLRAKYMEYSWSAGTVEEVGKLENVWRNTDSAQSRCFDIIQTSNALVSVIFITVPQF